MKSRVFSILNPSFQFAKEVPVLQQRNSDNEEAENEENDSSSDERGKK